MESLDNVSLSDTRSLRRTDVWVGLWFGVVTLIGLLNALHRYLNNVANGIPASFTFNLIEELTGSLSFGLMLPVLFAAIRRIRQLTHRWMRYACHVLLVLLLSVLHTSLTWGSRIWLFQLAGLGHYDYGVMFWRYVMEFPSDVFYYLLVAVVLWLIDRYRTAQRRELRAAQLESALSEARLDALRLQLNPHFLFNALNAISSIMYEHPRVADEMLARIGELLRATLSAKAQEHSLSEEWRLLALYLDIQRARFGEQLMAHIDTDPALGKAQVPFLVLQPLVENAIEHGGGDIRKVEITVQRCDGNLEFRVSNPVALGGGNTHSGHGIGLSNIEARLKHLYGSHAGLRLARDEGQEASVRLWLPYREGASA
ncbi:sensor histidine kinase [Dyella caseinilytica]|uniref:Histidine kinase n=1 Tax=Dyella caseinilytica TaxID=1849581 RepID=A0ABX7GYF5_9GAMM|nr:histidine kinase [Dyella caseinilytica]QRN55365.1 histidine kinase [Dyella caseinilytica]